MTTDQYGRPIKKRVVNEALVSIQACVFEGEISSGVT